MRVKTITGVLTMLAITGLAVSALAQGKPNDWKSGLWSGSTTYIQQQFLTCDAHYFNAQADEDHSFTLQHYGKALIKDHAASPLYMYFIDNGDDDDDADFKWLQGKTVTFAMGAVHATGKVVKVVESSFEFDVPAATVDALTVGGAFALQLPNGKRYGLQIPPSAEAMGYFRKCLEANAGR
jgi:hypothetical protein